MCDISDLSELWHDVSYSFLVLEINRWNKPNLALFRKAKIGCLFRKSSFWLFHFFPSNFSLFYKEKKANLAVYTKKLDLALLKKRAKFEKIGIKPKRAFSV